jgi:hypothetical protein
MKLLSKERNGAKVKKKYDKPKTPYQRLMDMPGISPKIKQRLKSEYAMLNPAQLKREITWLQERLFKTVARQRRSRKPSANSQANEPSKWYKLV